VRKWLLYFWLLGISAGIAQPPWPDFDPATGLWGYRLTEDSWHLDPQFAQVSRFREGLAIVSSREKRYVTVDGMIFSGEGPRLPNSYVWHPQWVINTQGKALWHLPEGYQVPKGAAFGSGMVPVRNAAGLFGYLNRRGEAQLPFVWQRAWSFSEQKALVQIPNAQLDSLFLTLSKSLQDTLDRRLRAWRRHPNFSQYRIKRPHAGMVYCLLNSSGKVEAFLPTWACIPEEENGHFLSNGLFVAENFFTKKRGVLDIQMQVALPFQFSQLGPLAEGKLFAVRHAARFESPLAGRGEAIIQGDTSFIGFIDLAGQPVFSLPFDFMPLDCGYTPHHEPFENGNGHLLLRPRYCEEFRRLRISQSGQLTLYQSWEE